MHHRLYDFAAPLDDTWEAIPEKGWTWEMSPGAARLANSTEGNAEIYLRPCCIYGDTIEFRFAAGAPRTGRFRFGFIGGFEFVRAELDLGTGALTVSTQEFHKRQPRWEGKVPTSFTSLKIVRDQDALPGLPYEGSKVVLLFDDRPLVTVNAIDFVPEGLFLFGLCGPGECTLASWSISGPDRPRPEYVRVGVWQQSGKPTTAANVDGLIEGVRQAAAAGVQILLTPETSLTGLRAMTGEMVDRAGIQTELRRFQEAVARTSNAPYTVVGYPDWVPGSEFAGAELPEVPINLHRFVRPDGTLGPRMAKVHSCEEGLWHGRRYNLQRVAGVEVALGVCHDGHYQDVWAVGVMGGARLCLHPAAGGSLKGQIPEILAGYRGSGGSLDSFWVRCNAGGGSAILYPIKNRKVPETILAVPKDLTRESPTYPEYSTLGDVLAQARIRLWDATGCYPLRTLRAGAAAYRAWSSLIPKIEEV